MHLMQNSIMQKMIITLAILLLYKTTNAQQIAKLEISDVVLKTALTKNQVDTTAKPRPFRIKCSASLDKNMKPLFILDGVTILSSEFQKIDPNNIKSIEILKDANAIAMYGQQGVNGVIIIQLKQDCKNTVNTIS